MTTKHSLLTDSAPGIDLPSSVLVSQSDVSFSNAARNSGVILTACTEGTDEKLCQLANLEIRRIGSIRQYLLWKLLKLSFPLLFSLGLITAMLSLLAFLRFSSIKSRE